MTGNIYISGQIGSFDGTPGIELIDVVSQVKKQPKATAFNVHINSEGGLVDVGFDIYHYLKSLGRPITTIGSGIVASIATVIFMAGSKRLIRENTPFMIHLPWGGSMGTADELSKFATQLKSIEKKLVGFYKNTLNIQEQAILPLLKNETWLTATQLTDLGFTTSQQVAIAAKAYLKPNTMTKFTEKDRHWMESGSATNQPTDIGTPRSLFTFGARSGSDTPLASDLVIGISGMSFRNRTNDIWRRVWTDSDFTQSNIDNWNTAYNRGDYKDFGLGINTTLIYPETDLNSVTVSNGFYTVPNTILNIPTNAGGALTVERYSTYITQKYQAVNAGDVVRMFIRHYKTDSASWTPWRQIWTDENFSPDDKAEVNDTLSFKGIIPSNDDINNYTVNGFYSTESSTTANLPVEDKGILTVTSNGNDHSQTYTNYNSNEFYFRTSSPSGGGWNSWERVAKSSERVINNTLTSPPTAASLNSLYPSVNATFTVIAPNVEKGNMYVKTDNGWLVFTGNTVF